MNKSNIIIKMGEDAGLTKDSAEKTLNSLLNIIKEGLQQGEKISLAGFGSFTVSERKARKGRNPKTGEEIDIPASKTVKFTPAKGLKDNII